MKRRLEVLLFRGTGLLDRLIQWQTRGPYCHAAFLFPDGRQAESYPGVGVQMLPRFCDHGCKVDRFEVEISEEQVRDLVASVEKELGSRYDWWGDFCFLTRTHRGRADAGRWFCSELVFEKLAEQGVALLRATEAFVVSPSLLGRSPILNGPRT